MPKKELTNKDIEDLIEQAAADSNVTKDWSDEVSIKVLSYMRKRGVLHKSNQYACLSFINWSESLMQRFYLVAANAYIDRAITEHRMNGAPENECQIIEKFFRQKLCFNSAKHVMDGLDEGMSRERIISELGISATSDNSSSAPEALTKEQKSILTATRDSIRSAKNVAELIKDQTKDPSRRDVMQRRIDELQVSNARISNLLGDNSRDILKALDCIPPVDNVHYFSRFCSDNYEHIRKLTSLAYNVPDDMEAHIWFHGAASTLPEIEKFMRDIHKQCSFGAFIIGNAGSTPIAPDLEPSEAERKYGTNTDIISSMIDAAEKSQNIVEKITKKNIRDARKKTILDDFKKNPTTRKKAIMARRAGKKFDATGINKYSKLVGAFRPNNTVDLDSDDEQEIIDEVIKTEVEVEYADDDVDNNIKPIRVMGIDKDGNFGEADVRFNIPDEYAFEAGAEKDAQNKK